VVQLVYYLEMLRAYDRRDPGLRTST
jgi:hypothetical protein